MVDTSTIDTNMPSLTNAPRTALPESSPSWPSPDHEEPVAAASRSDSSGSHPRIRHLLSAAYIPPSHPPRTVSLDKRLGQQPVVSLGVKAETCGRERTHLRECSFEAFALLRVALDSFSGRCTGHDKCERKFAAVVVRDANYAGVFYVRVVE